MQQKTKISPYWMCQFAGWGVASLYWIFWMIKNGNTNFFWGFINIALTITTAVFITHIYYLLAKKRGWHLLNVGQLIPIVITALLPLAFFFLLFNILINYYTYHLYNEKSIIEFGDTVFLTMTTTGGRLMAIWLLAFHMYHYAKRGKEAETEKALLEVKAREAQLQNLKAQLNPHFLFNALNSVKSMILPEPENARRAVVLLSDILRNSLNASHKKHVTLEEELQHVKDYLEMEKIRFEERLKLKYDIHQNALKAMILPLSLQVLAENAIKHGINKKKAGGTIELKSYISAEHLHIDFINDGQYQKSNTESGIGLYNLKERLQLHYGKKATISIKNLNQQKVIVQMTTPLIHE